MKVKISYVTKEEQIVDMTPEDYCYLRATMLDPKYFPLKARDRDIAPADDEAENELYDYWDWRQSQIHEKN